MKKPVDAMLCESGGAVRRAIGSVTSAAVDMQRSILILLAMVLASAMPCAARAQAAEAPVRLASLEWPPYIGASMPDEGFAAALVRAAYAELGLSVEIQFHPWARALELARSGAVDGLFPEYYNAERETEFAFSAPLASGPLVLYKRREDELQYRPVSRGALESGLRALQAQRFGVVSGYLNTPAFDAADYLTKIEAADDATNLRNLVEGHIDLAVIDRRVAQHLISTRHPDYAAQIEALSPPLGEMQLYIAFSRKSPRMSEALEGFERGLEALRFKGQLTTLQMRYLDPPPR
jgi:polar amino acid transport system substrate-binding protein